MRPLHLNTIEIYMTTPIHAFTQNPVLKVILQRSPKGIKRLVFLSSLIAFVANTNTPEKEFVRNMNEVLQLSRGGDSSLELPIRLSKVLWGDREILKEEIAVLTNPTVSVYWKQKAAENIAKIVPAWFCYSTIEAIAADIMSYFTFATTTQAA